MARTRLKKHARGPLATFLVALSLLAPTAFAQRSRLRGPIQNDRRVALNGHVRPQARAENDQGPVDGSTVLTGLSVVLKSSAAQQQDLVQFLQEQQDPKSPNYRHWLTPEQYAERFGTSQDDLDKISAWLQQQGLNVVSVARGRNSIQFSGTARSVQTAFNTQLHHYRVNGRNHFANATEPTVPAELDVIISSIEGLDDFHLEPRLLLPNATPDYTSASGRHYLAPDDYATIYNIKPLYAAGLDGTGQSIVVAGQTQLDMTDVRSFRAQFGLSAVDPDVVLVPNLPNPGVSSTDVGEANLDLQWAGAIARNARIIYVYSRNVMDAVEYAIDQNLAPVISVSYGLCELQTSSAALRFYQTMAQQANAQGITWVNASGDAGGAGCSSGNSNVGSLSADSPSTVPEITGVGGTTLSEGTGTYWNASNSSSSSSALSYISETVWNDSTATSAAAGGGGSSVYFLKPSWQTGAGVPNDGARSVPDISMTASANHDGYLVYTGGAQAVYGGTSAGTPAFAGILALLNQSIARTGGQSGVGNINPKLYSLAQTSPAVFHDVTSGNNIISVSCGTRVRNCTSGSYGYSATAGYDLASGLGSIDAAKLVDSWTGLLLSDSKSTPGMVLTSSSSTVGSGDGVTITATLRGTNGVPPSGTVIFRAGSVYAGTATLIAQTDVSTAFFLIPGSSLIVGSNTISTEYSGDSNYSTATATIPITESSTQTGPAVISGLANAASFKSSFAPGMLLTVFGSQLAPSILSAPSLPLPSQLAGVSVTVNGVTAPLLYASPTQLNIQLPYQVAIGTAATVIVNNNGKQASTTLTVASTGPGIFVDQNFAPVPSAAGPRGQILTLFITGAGTVTPQPATGAGPDPTSTIVTLPRAVQNVSVTVGGVSAPLQFAGIPLGLTGVLQVNYQVPDTVPLGTNAVVVKVGDNASSPANLTVR